MSFRSLRVSERLIFAGEPRRNEPGGIFLPKVTDAFAPMIYSFLTSQLAENVNALCEAFGSFHARYFDPQPLIEDNVPSDYFYTSRLPREPAGGMDDFHGGPAEPRSVRFTATCRF